MLNDLITHTAGATGLKADIAKKAIGIVFNSAERQGSPMADTLFKKIAGARTLSARTGSDIGACSGIIARMIEQTPGGRRHVASCMIRELHTLGLGHKEIGQLLPAIASFAEDTYGLTGFGHMGDLFGTDMDADLPRTAVAA